MKLINSPAGALSMEVQKRMHIQTTEKAAEEVVGIVQELITDGIHPLEAQLAAPIFYHNRNGKQ